MRLIIVDDSQIIREKLRELLQDIDDLEIVAEAEDGIDALEKFQQHYPDIIILDLKIPKLDGIKVLQTIKTGDVPVVVIVLTNFGNKYFKDACINYGADYFLDKTIDFEEVYTICKNLTEQKN